MGWHGPPLHHSSGVRGACLNHPEGLVWSAFPVWWAVFMQGSKGAKATAPAAAATWNCAVNDDGG
jgi:hypothetical protein